MATTDECCTLQMESRLNSKSRIPQAGLTEMNSAKTNSRSGLKPPGFATAGLKPSATSKTSTTTNRHHQPSASTSKIPNGAPRAHSRTNSFSSSVSTRTTQSRATSASSSQTVGTGSRAARPQTSMTQRKPGATSIARPHTSLDTHEEESPNSVLGKRKGMQNSLKPYQVTPGSYDKHLNCTIQWTPPFIPSSTPDGLPPQRRDASISTLMSKLSLSDPVTAPEDQVKPAKKTCKIPSRPKSTRLPLRQTKSTQLAHSPSRRKLGSPQKKESVTPFLTKYSQIKAWDETRFQDFESFTSNFFEKFTQVSQNSDVMKDAVNIYKSRVDELERNRDELLTTNCSLRIEVESMKNKVSTAEEAVKIAETEHEIAMDEYEQRLRIETDTVREESQKQLQLLISQHQNEIEDLRLRHQRELDDERTTYQRELGQVNSQNALETQKVHLEVANKDRQIESLQRDLRAALDDIEAEKSKNRELRGHLGTASNNTLTLESSIRALKARIEFLESGSQEQSQAFERLQKQLEDALAETNEAKEKLRKEETLRRKLHNQVQELKGNIRVFCRVRPPLASEPESDIAQIAFPDDAEDCKEIAIMGPEERSSLGTVSRKNNAFSFDRVFGPSNQNADVFEEISQLVQSALDGYNVCIFCYGQTGSGKTHTMSSADGMIPRAVHQIYDTAKSLEEKGWTYTMEGNFVEVYNENLNDLLGKADDLDKKRHEIRHDMQRCKTTITDVTTVTLDSPEMVESILKRAAANRSVAATKANERSSRSHSVFILRLLGHNTITGERCEGTLNLVDLAGSERLSHSGATGERLKETQNINRSLSCLGDVIGALGSGKEGGHIPYRNSKLTYLLQFSLGGNSKTLMFVMVSPLQAHLGETLTSLKFATKVHNTHIGTAKRVSKIQN
ncbi:kinesin family protein (KlpA), putative [Talaromyces stipitatus ATCC 10500]|uniref:Kinesin-like protein n=1 Tax=Talaromyces stipitatus (strain ATCC 10500 / CBS 375.48 / QM 6759 / NRRL 1006) TaxID=441959 RepID=B8M7T9_TALSN|nr:kinesin family protein (KlpA), putative [Talaromyces stipitatus ATCC 10500]EED19818.1 kinesin family protein (KlpA), putative [Talaromyces stipitatus ATCC 10500]